MAPNRKNTAICWKFVSARWAGISRAREPKPILLLGHLDTVWPRGTLAKMPFRVAKGKAFGPGVYDMKAGIVMAMHAWRCFASGDAQARR